MNRAPWDAFGLANPDPLNNQVLELYDLNHDFSQATDLAAVNPQTVKEMKVAFLAQAKKDQVFPLNASVVARIVAPRPNITAGRDTFVSTHPMLGLNRTLLAGTTLHSRSSTKDRGRAPWPSTTSAVSAALQPATSRWMARWWPPNPWPKPCPSPCALRIFGHSTILSR